MACTDPDGFSNTEYQIGAAIEDSQRKVEAKEKRERQWKVGEFYNDNVWYDYGNGGSSLCLKQV